MAIPGRLETDTAAPVGSAAVIRAVGSAVSAVLDSLSAHSAALTEHETVGL